MVIHSETASRLDRCPKGGSALLGAAAVQSEVQINGIPKKEMLEVAST
jgi:hypothetical protein